ncbi:hypothetical protein AGMMS49974_09900 [Deltaproteobacteria bacterium]|nr:hypothetical protein AGMMS49974_09900 [Deltaproteobacteria bacterium]
MAGVNCTANFSCVLSSSSIDRIESAVSGNVFVETNLCIARLDKLSRNEEIQEKLRITDLDLIVCDEAHKMSATVWGGEIKTTKRFQLVCVREVRA